jgi:hypothetical protein
VCRSSPPDPWTIARWDGMAPRQQGSGRMARTQSHGMATLRPWALRTPTGARLTYLHLDGVAGASWSFSTALGRAGESGASTTLPMRIHPRSWHGIGLTWAWRRSSRPAPKSAGECDIGTYLVHGRLRWCIAEPSDLTSAAVYSTSRSVRFPRASGRFRRERTNRLHRRGSQLRRCPHMVRWPFHHKRAPNSWASASLAPLSLPDREHRACLGKCRLLL